MKTSDTPKKKRKPAKPKKRGLHGKKVGLDNLEKMMSLVVIPETPEEKEAREKKETLDMLTRLGERFEIKSRGRPSKMTEATLGKIMTTLAIGTTIEEACTYAGIHPDTYYDFAKKNQEFSDMCDMLRLKAPLKARVSVSKALDDPKNFEFAYRYLRDKYPAEFSKYTLATRTEEGDIIPVGGPTVNIVFAPNLGRSQFYKEIPEEKSPIK